MNRPALTHFLADDGEAIHYTSAGAGQPIVLLHGWTASHRDWNPFVDALQVSHRVLRWDARGHGGHALHTTTAPTVARMARDLHQWLEAEGLADAVVVGHSMGALTLWQYLQDFGSARLARAVFIDQSPRLLTDAFWKGGIYGDFDAARNEDFERGLEADFAEGVLQLVAQGLNEAARSAYAANDPMIERVRERLRKLAPAPLIECWRSLVAADYRAVLPRIDVPALLIYGAQSNFYSLDVARYVRGAIPDARLHVYDGVDHAPHLWQPGRFLHDVLAFTGAGCAPECAVCA